MREIVSENPNSSIEVLDEPGDGGANHEYHVLSFDKRIPILGGENQISMVSANVKFQKGPIREHGINGCHQEDLLSIVIDRLQSFQAGSFPCRENALALTKCQEALHWLNHRTRNRQLRGVEGISKK